MEQEIDNAFAELELSRDATETQVKAAWRRLVSQWHPDRNDSAAAVAKMQRINRAVEAIRRAGFLAPASSPGADGATPRRAEEPKRRGGGDPGEAGSGGSDGSATAGQTGPETPARTIHRKVRLTLEEAAFGCTKVLRGKVTDACSACDGAGYRVLGGHCAQCQGSGAIRQRSWFGWVGTQTECEACHGGGIARQRCSACAGSGKAATQRYQVTVRFPHGVRDGDLLDVARRHGKPGSPPADLSIRVEVREHDLLELAPDGTVLCEMPVDGFAWIANRAVDVPTLGGLRAVQLQRDQLSYRLKGQGFPVERRGPRGDQVVTIVPIFPHEMSTDQQILLDQLIATTSGPAAERADARLRAWGEGLRAWKRGAPRRG